MVAVAHICKRFAMDFANDILADSDFDLAINVHGGAHWEATAIGLRSATLRDILHQSVSSIYIVYII